MYKQLPRKLATLVILIALLAMAIPLGFACAGASRPEAAFSADPTSGTFPLEVQFTNQSMGEITDWEWDFDNDGTVDSTEQNPSYTYETAGTYTVSLKVVGPGGSDTETKVDYVHETLIIMIGHLTDLTGAAALSLVPITYALEDLVRYINEEDPIVGVELRVVTFDTKYDPARFIPGYEWCKGKGAQVIFASIPAIGETLKSFAAADWLPVVNVYATVPEIEPPGWVFCLNSPACYQAKTLLKWISEQWDYEGFARKPKVGFVGWDMSYDMEMKEGAKEYCLGHQDNFDWVGSFLVPAGTMVWAGEVQMLKDCDYICLSSIGIAAATFMNEFRVRGYAATFIGMDALAAYQNLLLDYCGWEALDGTLTAYPMLYIGGLQQVDFLFDILRAAVEGVGAENFDGQAFYDAATGFTATYEGYPEWGFTETKRYSVDHLVIYEWSAEAEDLVRISDWLPIVID